MNDDVGRIYSLHQILCGQYEYVQELADCTSGQQPWLTGFPQIDNIVGPVGVGLVSIESDTPCLDTQLALLTGLHTGKELPVAFVTSKLSVHTVGELLLCLNGGIARQNLNTGQLTDQEWFVLTNQCQKPVAQYLDVLELPAVTTKEMQRTLERMASERGKLCTVVVDDVLALSDLSQFGATSHSQGQNLANHFKDLANSLGCAMVMVVPTELAHGFASIADVHMRLEAVHCKGGTPTFPARALVHLSRSGFGHLGAASIDFGAIHETAL